MKLFENLVGDYALQVSDLATDERTCIAVNIIVAEFLIIHSAGLRDLSYSSALDKFDFDNYLENRLIDIGIMDGSQFEHSLDFSWELTDKANYYILEIGVDYRHIIHKEGVDTTFKETITIPLPDYTELLYEDYFSGECLVHTGSDQLSFDVEALPVTSAFAVVMSLLAGNYNNASNVTLIKIKDAITRYLNVALLETTRSSVGKTISPDGIFCFENLSLSLAGLGLMPSHSNPHPCTATYCMQIQPKAPEARISLDEFLIQQEPNIIRDVDPVAFDVTVPVSWPVLDRTNGLNKSRLDGFFANQLTQALGLDASVERKIEVHYPQLTLDQLHDAERDSSDVSMRFTVTTFPSK